MLAARSRTTYVDPFDLVCHGLGRASGAHPQPQTWVKLVQYTKPAGHGASKANDGPRASGRGGGRAAGTGEQGGAAGVGRGGGFDPGARGNCPRSAWDSPLELSDPRGIDL